MRRRTLLRRRPMESGNMTLSGEGNQRADNGVISDKDVDFYNRHGYLLIGNVLSPGDLASLRAQVDAWVEASRAIDHNDDFYDLEDTHSASAPRVRRFTFPDRRSGVFRKLVDHPVVMLALERLWGCGVRFAKSKLNMKTAGGGAAVEWHQDWAFYPHTNDCVAAVGFMIDDMTPENGAMMVIPGSHRGPVYSHHANGVFCGAIDVLEQKLDVSAAVHITGPAGTVTIHHARTLHASAPNHSAMPRRFLLHQYAAADAWPLLGIRDYDVFRAGLVSGREVETPRMESLPVRLPYPGAPTRGSIYEYQRALGHRFFDEKSPPETARRNRG